MRDELLEAPLVPNKQAAGVVLGAKIKAVQELWGEPAEREQISPHVVRWSYDRVWFWFKAGKVDQIAVFTGYRGRTKEGLGISSTREEVEHVHGHLEWDGCWLINVPPFGIGFDFGDLPTNFTQVTGIYIFRE